MRKIGLIAAMICAGLNLFGQNKTHHEMKGKDAERVRSALSLTEEQYSQWKAIHKKYRDEHARLRADTSQTREQRHFERKEIERARKNAIRQMLTEEQFEEWLAMDKRNHSRRYTHRCAGNPMREMQTVLDLTDAQVKELRAIDLQTAEAYKKLRSDTTISETREARSEAIKLIRQQRRAAIRKVLTQDQYEKFVALVAERRIGRSGF